MTLKPFPDESPYARANVEGTRQAVRYAYQ